VLLQRLRIVESVLIAEDHHRHEEKHYKSDFLASVWLDGFLHYLPVLLFKKI
jgi:hypothetical protein